MRILALALIVLGLAGLVYGGLSWTQRDTVIDVGPLEVTKEERKGLPITPVAGGLLIAAGAGLLLMKRG